MLLTILQALDSPQQRLIRAKVSTALKWRNPGLEPHRTASTHTDNKREKGLNLHAPKGAPFVQSWEEQC